MPSPPARAARWSAAALAEGFQLACAAEAVRRLGLIEAMAEPASPEALARRHGLDAEMLAGTLDYLSQRTDLIRKRGRTYVAAGWDEEARFLLGLYVSAYGPTGARLADWLRRPTRARASVDQAQQARVFAAAPAADGAVVAGLLHQLGTGPLLELGCGTGGVLAALGAADPAFRGWGLDASAPMCSAARRRVREAGLSRRIRIRVGDGRYPERSLTARERAQVATLLAADFANEFVRGDGRAAICWLRRLRRQFPGRTLVISDYYGRLGRRPGADPRHLLHDFVQLISGQGIPPADLDGWQHLYARAGCRLAHAIEDRSTTRFVHLLKL